MSVERPTTPSHLMHVSRALGDFVNVHKLVDPEDVVAYVIDHTVPDWESQPAAWYVPRTRNICINLGILYRENQQRILASGKYDRLASGMYVPHADIVRGIGNNIDSINRATDDAKPSGGHAVGQFYKTMNGLRSAYDVRVDSYVDLELFFALQSIGIFVHETGHSLSSTYLHSDWFRKMDGYGRQIMTMFEELRCEATQVRRIGGERGRRFLRVALPIVVDPKRFKADMDKALTAGEDIDIPSVALNSTLMLGRTVTKVLLPYEMRDVAAFIEDNVGASRLAAMKQIWADYVDISDVNALNGKEARDCVDRWKELFPEEDRTTEGSMSTIGGDPEGEEGDENGSTATGAGDKKGKGSGSGSEDKNGKKGGAHSVKSDSRPDTPDFSKKMAEVVDRALINVSENPDNMLDYDPSGPTPSRISMAKTLKDESRARGNSGVKELKVTGREQRMANKLARDLEKLSLVGREKFKINSVVPPGRMRGRAAVQRSAERRTGRIPTSEPWKRNKTVVDLNPPLTVGVMTDISGSQGWATEFSSTLSWVLSRAVHEVNGRVATVVFGEYVIPTLRPGEHPTMRTEVPACQGHEQFDQGVGTLDVMLNLMGGQGVRLLFVVSDGNFVLGGEQGRAAEWVRRLNSKGVGVVWMTPHAKKESWSGRQLCPEGAVHVQVDKRGRYSDDYSQADFIEQHVNKIANAIKKAIVSARGGH